MPIYDYRCARRHITESIQPMDRSVIACSVCDSPANRLGAYRVAVTLPEIDMRGKFRRYNEATAEMDYAAQKVEASTGQAVQAPSYWAMAKQRANALLARGEQPANARKEQMK